LDDARREFERSVSLFRSLGARRDIAAVEAEQQRLVAA
jgi:hypothetical protein